MRLPKSRWVGLGVSVVLVAAVAGITLGVTTLLGVTFQGTGEAEQSVDAQQGPGSQMVANPLATANRDRLAVCVQAVDVDASVEVAAKPRIEAALVQVAEHPHWEPYGLAAAVASPVVDIGCPSDPPPPYPGVKIPVDNVRPHIVSEASYYRVFVFLLPPPQLDAFVGSLPLRRAPQEMLCEGDACWEVTTGLYLSVDDLDDAPFLVDWLNKAIGLESTR